MACVVCNEITTRRCSNCDVPRCKVCRKAHKNHCYLVFITHEVKNADKLKTWTQGSSDDELPAKFEDFVASYTRTGTRYRSSGCEQEYDTLKDRDYKAAISYYTCKVEPVSFTSFQHIKRYKDGNLPSCVFYNKEVECKVKAEAEMYLRLKQKFILVIVKGEYELNKHGILYLWYLC